MRIASWREPDAFPPPPSDADHGWWDKGTPRAASREELLSHVRSTRGRAPLLVWAPESGARTLADCELEFLREAVRERDRSAAERAAYAGAGYFFLWTLFWLLLAKGGGGTAERFGAFWMWAFFGLLPLAIGGWRVFWHRRKAGRGDGFSNEDADEARFFGWVGRRRAPVTVCCSGGLILVCLCALFAGGVAAADAAGLRKTAFWGGEWWRLATGPWLHLQPMHAYFNLAALWYLGRNVEALFGWRWLVVVLASALVAGSLASACWLDATSVGFSGAILGLLGLQLGVQSRRPGCLPRTLRRQGWLSVVLTGLVGALGWRIIDNAAHGGGLLAGAWLGWMLAGKMGDEGVVPEPRAWATSIAALGLVASGAVTLALLIARFG